MCLGAGEQAVELPVALVKEEDGAVSGRTRLDRPDLAQ